ncbi:MAG: YebC/PmpR family DNA-binding transcriptional regulator [Firmicutes bacterium]|jgi:YebC/PmpR family DNA-binding regulatory protein|nr:YebC/PmpR family DNA-binding transcriptional regulator [Bacillota bacterium]
MAGHSKWSNIKHRKGKEDARRGQIFTKLARQITLAAREGGGDPQHNFRLRLAIEKARDANMPNDNIERAIKRGTGELEGDRLEEVVYEGYGPAGMAILLEALTDNRNRTASDLRHLFSKHGGNLGESGCVSWMFEKKGRLVINKEANPVDEEALMLEAIESGAEDIEVEENYVEIITAPGDFQTVKESLEASGYVFEEAEVTMIPTNTVEIPPDKTEQALKLLEALEELDDIQQVYANGDFDEEAIAAAGA